MNDLIDEGRAAGLSFAAVRVDPVAAGGQHTSRYAYPVHAASAVCAGSTTGIREFEGADAGNGRTRSELDDWRTALHEGGHVVVGRALGEEVGGVTIVEGPDYGGLTWGPRYVRSRLYGSDHEVTDLCEKIGPLMPQAGEPRSNATEAFAHVFVRVVDLCAGTAAETVLHPDDAPWVAYSDIRQARALASIICTSEAAIDAYLLFGLAEAKALIMQHRVAVLAIAETLMIERTLNSEQIDTIIASAPERARRADWLQVLENAADFVPHGSKT